MNSTVSDIRLKLAKDLMNGFAGRTGLSETADESEVGNVARRYLWTDALALLNLLAMAQLEQEEKFTGQARRLVRQVHHHLGRYAAQDDRRGWISGLPDELAPDHPTAGGLRIGKPLPERQEGEPYDARLEWDRDGQYYHYHTRWIAALLKASQTLDSKTLADWALELSLAGKKFIRELPNGLILSWKMSVDLSRPLVPTMSPHDPLGGLLVALDASQQSQLALPDLPTYLARLEGLCSQASWDTDDALGIGGLMLDLLRATRLYLSIDLPESIKPDRLLRAITPGLVNFLTHFDSGEAARYRLAFRECGLSLGLRCVQGHLAWLKEQGIEPDWPESVWQLPEQIENFWLQEQNQQADSFKDHLDINEVSLAASLLAGPQPAIYA
ncbi:hypothetical protein [Bowmanella dokdonensis]|uniref:Uncharacterized protein n=1 Tax=Bowmanella dokdonensis TaxID=751969 RepID=A0A939DQL8_9ALTE|nr:hypothetical protein [Bowmanella dokdonensis]MBN7827179.1 hypothetical protein [Bowmanella dokdonensis]